MSQVCNLVEHHEVHQVSPPLPAKQTKKQKSKENDIPGEVEFVLLPQVSSWLAPVSPESLSQWVLCWGGGSLIACHSSCLEGDQKAALFQKRKERVRFNLEVQQYYGDAFFAGLILPQVLILTS